MAVVEVPHREHRAARSARVWRWTIGSGVALVVLATVHIVAQHFVVGEVGGLRNYRQVIDYVGNPVMLAIEFGFLVAVTIHALLGVRGVLFDLVRGVRTRKRIDAALWVLGVATVAYGSALLTTLTLR